MKILEKIDDSKFEGYEVRNAAGISGGTHSEIDCASFEGDEYIDEGSSNDWEAGWYTGQDPDIIRPVFPGSNGNVFITSNRGKGSKIVVSSTSSIVSGRKSIICRKKRF